jgi:hypothetical protein
MTFLSKLLFFTFFLFGLINIFRISQRIWKKSKTFLAHKKLILVCLISFVVIFLCWAEFNHINGLIFLLLVECLSLGHEKLNSFLLKTRFKDYEIQFVRRVYLKTSSGKSPMDAVITVCQENDDSFSDFNKSLLNLVSFRQQIDDKNLENYQLKLVHWVFLLTQNPVNALEKIKSMEEKLIIENDLRRRSGQALLGLKIQSLIMTILYLIAVMFVSSTYGLLKNWHYVLMSMVIFVLGLIWVFRLGRGIKWNI